MIRFRKPDIFFKLLVLVRMCKSTTWLSTPHTYMSKHSFWQRVLNIYYTADEIAKNGDISTLSLVFDTSLVISLYRNCTSMRVIQCSIHCANVHRKPCSRTKVGKLYLPGRPTRFSRLKYGHLGNWKNRTIWLFNRTSRPVARNPVGKLQVLWIDDRYVDSDWCTIDVLIKENLWQRVPGFDSQMK